MEGDGLLWPNFMVNRLCSPGRIQAWCLIDKIVERNYRGDVILDQRRWQPDEKVNDNLNIDNSISILQIVCL